MGTNPPEIRISASKTVRFLFAILLFFFAGSLTARYIGWKTGHRHLGGIVPILNMDGDNGAPTWYNSFLLMATALVAALIARYQVADKARFRFHWNALAVVFLFMSVDEVACIHEKIGHFIYARLGTVGLSHGIFASGFILPGLILSIAALFFFVPLLRSLPKKTAWMLLLSGAVYLSGALLTETWTMMIWDTQGASNLIYRIGTHVEEVFEMSGLILFLKVGFDLLKSYTSGSAPGCRIWIES